MKIPITIPTTTISTLEIAEVIKAELAGMPELISTATYTLNAFTLCTIAATTIYIITKLFRKDD